MRYLFGFMCVLALSVVLVACGGEGEGCAEPVDAAGDWEMTSTVVSDNCDGRTSQTFRMKITQDGNALTAETPELTFSGTICGNQIQMKGSSPEDDGSVTVNATLIVSAEGDSMQGSDNWTWTDGSESCSGSDSLSGTRIMTDGCEGAVDGTACSGGACLDGECTPLVTVSGRATQVETLDEEEFPAVGATVSVVGTSLSTTTNERGEFSFGVFTGDWFFQASKPGTWGWIEQETVPAAGRSDLETGVLTDGFMVELENLLQIDVDDTKGMIWMTFLPNSGRGGETATLSESRDGGLTSDVDGNWAASEVLLQGGSPDLGFYDVGLTEELSVMPEGVAGVNECTLNDPELVYPIRAKHQTVGVGITCNSIP
ncbi:carboxypeptidase-like regulatory domain-containing protein [Deltaproteobacteria bacterium]|nr:carboxypeptidase-like regulatory domain-containing protein [Deltaproteobacteria bacterium]